jgi:CheY-like chemotaxis protein
VVDLVTRTIETPLGRGETILIVEDDATVRLILCDVLGELGYNVLVASDARPAIPMLQSAKGASARVFLQHRDKFKRRLSACPLANANDNWPAIRFTHEHGDGFD